jgi:hypothetical protein
MVALRRHYARCRAAHPKDRLLLLFEIDGPIVDPRHAVRRRLLDYDQIHGTDHFRAVGVNEIDQDGEDLRRLFIRRELAAPVQRDVLGWYGNEAPGPRSRPGVEGAHPGVLEVIRWFQLQKGTFVGLNTNRPESMRADTLCSLNTLGRELGLAFDPVLLHMRQPAHDQDAVAAKLEGLRAFRRAGYRPIAVVDHDPAVICSMVESNDADDFLFLQTRPTTASPRLTGARTAAGRHFDLAALAEEADLPTEVQLVWHGINDELNLGEFLSSSIGWGECDVRRDPRQRLVLRHDSFGRTPWRRDESLLPLATALEAFAGHGRGLKLDLKDGPDVLDELLDLVEDCRFDDDHLWFNASIEAVDAKGFQRLRSAHPAATIQCPIDFLGPLVAAAPGQARAVLRMLTGWGINRFSVAWGQESTSLLRRQLVEWGHQVNLYAVPDHASFLQAVLLLPRSLTADFNFPDWNYYGRGSGEKGRYHRYPNRQPAPVESPAREARAPSRDVRWLRRCVPCQTVTTDRRQVIRSRLSAGSSGSRSP